MSPAVRTLLDWIRDNLIFLVLGLAVVLFFLLRTSPTQGIDSLETLDATLNSGQPVVLEFYSNL